MKVFVGFKKTHQFKKEKIKCNAEETVSSAGSAAKSILAFFFHYYYIT